MQAWYFLFALLFALQANGHSMMTCGVIDGNNCVGAVREAFSSLQQTNYAFDGTNPCQPTGRGVSNLANKYSTANPMGKLKSGQTFTVQWKARNHAVANQSPRVVKMYLSPAIQSGQTNDYSWNTFKSNMFCTGPFTNCGKGANVDTLGDDIPCTLTCTLPTLADGTYTMLWHWNWTQNDGKDYMTCADLQIGSANAQSQNPVQTSAPATSIQTSASSAQRSSASSSAQRSSASSSAQRSSASSSAQRTSQQQTTELSSAQQSDREEIPITQANSASNRNEGTTTSSGCPDMVQQCKDTCGESGVTTCSCVGGQFKVVCKDTESSSNLLTISALLTFAIALF